MVSSNVFELAISKDDGINVPQEEGHDFFQSLTGASDSLQVWRID